VCRLRSEAAHLHLVTACDSAMLLVVLNLEGHQTARIFRVISTDAAHLHAHVLGCLKSRGPSDRSDISGNKHRLPEVFEKDAVCLRDSLQTLAYKL
jgi:hypothetical protein